MTQSPSGPVLVTGATGFLGSAVVRALLAAERPVRCLVRSTSRVDRLAGLRVDVVIGDVRDRGAVDAAVGGCGSVVHLAGPSAWSTLDSPDETNVIVDGTAHVVDAARRAGARRVVHISTAAVLGPTESPVPRDETSPESPVRPGTMPYVEAKRSAEGACRRAAREGFEVVIVNPCEVFGPGDRDLITAGNLLPILGSRVPLVCTGGTAIAHVDDIADAIVRALRVGRSGERYFLGGDNLSHRELARLLLSICGRDAPAVVVPNAVVKSAAKLTQWLCLPFSVPRAAVPYVTSYWHLRADKARHELGARFRPAYETLAVTLSWLRSVGHRFTVTADSRLANDISSLPVNGPA